MGDAVFFSHKNMSEIKLKKVAYCSSLSYFFPSVQKVVGEVNFTKYFFQNSLASFNANGSSTPYTLYDTEDERKSLGSASEELLSGVHTCLLFFLLPFAWLERRLGRPPPPYAQLPMSSSGPLPAAGTHHTRYAAARPFSSLPAVHI
jgi:hypothetical protein